MINCDVEYIHPYGRRFILYTDKEWSKGRIHLTTKDVILEGTQTYRFPLVSIVSVDKKIALPTIKEGRSTLLLEYVDIVQKERIFTLFSGYGACIRSFKKHLLSLLTSNVYITYKIQDKWERGFMRAQDSDIIFVPSNYKFHISKLLKFERRSMSTGFSNVGVIVLKVEEGEDTREIWVVTPPLKRDFFWQLLGIMNEEYIYSQLLSKLTRTERLILLLVNEGATVEEILQKHQITPEEFKDITDKLEELGLIKKIIILRITDKGKGILEHITE
ncbi:hypothetical protein B6U71_02195 [Euryarchaeota archaeon ex4484_178]|nr:MAG: hypothetical protein B6U71_02195 [Euryarchaeota archaeon ex4484_178]